jgi:hypothetical protein
MLNLGSLGNLENLGNLEDGIMVHEVESFSYKMV